MTWDITQKLCVASWFHLTFLCVRWSSDHLSVTQEFPRSIRNCNLCRLEWTACRAIQHQSESVGKNSAWGCSNDRHRLFRSKNCAADETKTTENDSDEGIYLQCQCQFDNKQLEYLPQIIYGRHTKHIYDLLGHANDLRNCILFLLFFETERKGTHTQSQ